MVWTVQGHCAAGCQVRKTSTHICYKVYYADRRSTIRFSEEFADARFYKVDVDELPEVAQEQNVRAMPTFLLFKGGKKVGEVVGANPTALESAIKNNL